MATKFFSWNALDLMIWTFPDDDLRTEETLIRAAFVPLEPSLLPTLSQLPEVSLAEAAQRDFFRREVFQELLVNRYHKILGSWIRTWNFARNRDESNELVQEIYSHIYKKLKENAFGFEVSKGAFLTYLRTIAHHVCVSRTRVEARQPETAEALDTHPIDEDRASEEARSELTEVLEKLPDQDMRHIVRSEMDGYTVREIARQLGVSERRVYHRRSLAHQQLEQLLRSTDRDITQT